MSHRKLLSQGNVPFSWEEKPGISKFCFPDFQALALHSVQGDSEFDVVRKIPPPPCRLQPRSVHRWEEDPFVVAYKECTKSVQNGKFVARGSKGGVAVVKKSKLFGFSCKSFDSCEIREDSLFKLGRDRIGVSSWK